MLVELLLLSGFHFTGHKIEMIITVTSWKYRASQVVLVVKNPPANAGDIRVADSIPESGRCPGEGTGYQLQYSCMENPMDRGTWWSIVHRVAKSLTQLK